MKKTRTLALRRETLADLTTTDLRDVVGGASFPWGGCTTDTIAESAFACSLRCQWTFNTCECAG